MQAFVVLYMFLSINQASALDLSHYKISESQRAMLTRMSTKGIPEEDILRFAANLEEHMAHPTTATLPYIPPHKPDDIEAVTRWAEGAAFASWARDAGVTFDSAAYRAACPNQALFNFGIATSMEYLHADVTVRNVNRGYQLSLLLNKNKATFHDEYMRLIKDTEFAKYVTDGAASATSPAVQPATIAKPATTAN